MASVAKVVIQKLALSDDQFNGAATTRWINPDITPLPPPRRTWGRVAYLGFGSIANLCISTWAGGSSLVILGLSIPQVIGVMIIARVVIAFLVIGNGWMGGEWHIGFTVAQRLIFGVHGSYIGILIRILLSIIWYGSQAWLGGLCVAVILSSWSHSFLTMENTLPESAHVVTRDLIGFTIFHFLSVPLLLVRPEKSKWPVVFASVTTFFVMLGICIWATTQAGGPGPLWHQGSTDIGYMSHAWAWVYGIVASVGGISAGILNQSDFTRFARKQGVQVPGMLFSLFIPGMAVPIMGILTASASVKIYGGEPYWNPLTLITQWMLDDYSAKSRAAAFFCGLGFLISQLAENILGNGYAAGMDMAGLLPKFINIRRGALICAALSWSVQPWLFYNTSSVFVATAASFSVFMGPLTGVMMADYFIIRRQRIEVSQLYTGSPEGSYYYFYGFNLRAIISWVVCFVPAMPGMIATLNPSIPTSQGAINYYRGNYLFGYCEAAVLYIAICYIWRIKNAGKQDEYDIYGTFDESAAERKGIAPFLGKKEEVAEGLEVPTEAQDIERMGIQQTESLKAPTVTYN
ncbi:uncharacterized protein Z518_06276 [Rhinocladiella mackenziei CBS 650.93]|uniref:Thiamine transporter n=1 Tax=Rhinocladiella mackenziei CBS 650.93 TaxID=1442369 RepID=A0A0D2II18_9EURO|nr:uncharacterized protein Z518_06276 [Rhinocladiella mackenziei CBS 650.93]KIX05404.1 hypothetical protein Z518_06276 [Rhinocladiella mackenziei CBS 650.93]